jgi:hypothetical protein
MNVGQYWKRQILLQRLEIKMSQIMDLLRGPAFGVVFMIILLAGVIIVTAFAALIAQMSLLLRMKPWNASEKGSQGQASEERSSEKAALSVQPLPNVNAHHRNIPEEGRWWFLSRMQTK